MRKRRVLILSEGFGSGHTQAGHALAAGLKRMDPQIRTKVLELGSFLNPTVAPLILSAYRMTVNTSPALVGLFYRHKYEKPVGRLARLALHKMFYQHAADVIAQLRPDLIVCTHPIPSAIISYLKLAAGLDVPLCTLITDYDAHGSWMSPGVDQYLVSAPEVKALLVQRGVAPYKVQVTGIPVHPDFWSKQEKTSAREDLGLKQMPTALVMGGGWGLLFSEELLAKLAAWREKIQIVCCMGSNEKLAVKLRAHPALQHPNIKVIGFTREIGKWMDASDLLITKPGGMTCTEGMAKGIPMLFFESIPGQEEKNREYFVQRGFGANLDSPDVLDDWFDIIHGRHAAVSQADPESAARQDGYRPDRCAGAVISLLHPSAAPARVRLQTAGPAEQRAN
ncbi:MAG: UDP-N-acetylglucosamine--LPS N-acetylglucosamine transferase [Paenibacillaceae bacterium]|uniref:UDP-N-acetylglucosamine--LPS N-acetylglucosamine transferase n=1 Tax=Paenibacillus mellifer TaxID=2937794 RepID=A0A9X1XUD2_9BACL|nr:glycosyltransferase [Paenibacillus mellifer]MBW4840863.1 UDP-N-acetylglucosamine--LPS N-acetylglucosamine transferase [Paenibacillaceae bacterium]MCK8485745.1 UDP-N-acetylglucosamine--LPS N-acetylglucosamine transferase [Paenibacillus mellifer]